MAQDEDWWEPPTQAEMDAAYADAITDAALDILAVALRRAGGQKYAKCDGCDLLVHHTDLTTHARECEPLRALAAEAVDG